MQGIAMSGLVERLVAQAQGASACDDSEFVELLAAYRASGGIARASELVAAHQDDAPRRQALVDVLVTSGHVVHFGWAGQCWLPVFQFNRPGLKLRPALPRVIDALSPALDAWGVALWFARPNPWLADARPADRMALHGVCVEQAAIADGCAFRA